MTGPLPLREYQIADLSFLIGNPRGGLLHEPGGGKTPPVCVFIFYRWNTEGKRTVWVMPKQLMRKNKVELLRFTHFKTEDVAIVDGTKEEVAAAIASDAKCFLMGPARFKLCWKELLTAHPDIKGLVGDETHLPGMWATHDSASVRAVYEFNKHCDSFVPMTGTLIKGRLSSAYPVFHCIEPRYYASFRAFMNYHCVEDDMGNPIYWNNTERIAEIVSRHFISRSFQSIYGAESKVIQTELADMSPKQLAAYSEFEANAIIELENSFLTAAQGGVHAIRCRQIMSHPETFGLTKGEMTGKDLLLDLHLENHANDKKPFVVFAAFVPEQERILRQIRAKGIKAELMNGSVSTNKRSDIDEAFRAGRIQAIVGSPIVATVGFNWEHCDHAIYSSLDYGDDTFYQSYRRFIRGVRNTPLLITVLEYANSLDQRIIAAIKRKSKLANQVSADREVFELSVA